MTSNINRRVTWLEMEFDFRLRIFDWYQRTWFRLRRHPPDSMIRPIVARSHRLIWIDWGCSFHCQAADAGNLVDVLRIGSGQFVCLCAACPMSDNGGHFDLAAGHQGESIGFTGRSTASEEATENGVYPPRVASDEVLHLTEIKVTINKPTPRRSRVNRLHFDSTWWITKSTWRPEISFRAKRCRVKGRNETFLTTRMETYNWTLLEQCGPHQWLSKARDCFVTFSSRHASRNEPGENESKRRILFPALISTKSANFDCVGCSMATVNDATHEAVAVQLNQWT